MSEFVRVTGTIYLLERLLESADSSTMKSDKTRAISEHVGNHLR